MNKNKKKIKKLISIAKPKKYTKERPKSYNMNNIKCFEPKKITKIEVTFD